MIICIDEFFENVGKGADYLEKELRMDVQRPETVDSSHKELNEKTQ